MYLAGFDRVGPESRYKRFLASVDHLSSAQVDYMVEVDHRDHEALIALDGATGDGVGIARFVRDPQMPEVAEAAVVVIDDWQGRGLGTALCRVLAERARELGISRFDATLLAENDRMMGVLEALGPTRVVAQEGASVVVQVSLPEQGIGEHMTGVLKAVAAGSFELATPPGGNRLPAGDA